MNTQLLPVTRAAALEQKSATASWLVRELWSHAAVGFVAGHPKAGKSFMVLDLALSVASGTPCLGHFPVEQPGPALVYLAEDTLPCVRERIAALCTHRGLPIETLDLYCITAPSLRLDNASDQARLAATLDAYKPRLLVLDPLVRLHACDENRADEVSALLGFLRTLQRQHQVAIVVVHHLSKKHRRDLGQSLRGSGDLHAWSDSSAYLVRRNDQIVVTLEHRSEKAPPPLTLTLALGADGKSPHLERVTSSGEPVPPPLSERIRELLSRQKSPLSRVALRDHLRINNLRLGQELSALESQGLVARTPSGWVLAAPHS
jgi:RecA-family ATPase